MGCIVRRLVVGVLLVAALAPPVAHGQPRVWRVGLFHVGLDHDPPALAPLRDTLKRLGYEDGKSIRLDYRNQADEEAARATARAFVRERVDLIVAFENQAVRAAQAATADIPVVFAHVSDPVASGFVKSLARPGGNLTGVVDYVGELQDKRIQILGEMVRLRRLLILTDPTDPATPRLTAEITRAAPQLKVDIVERRATTETDVTKIFAGLRKGEMLAEQGALLSYGPDFAALGRAVAGYVDRILKGAKPADLPVQQAAQLELVINLRTARAFGIAVPHSLLVRANEVID
jgi:putative ABC transport system substrate-binding protein